MHLLQIDSVNALIRSHYLPIYSRIGPYAKAELDRRTLASAGRTLFEYWAHEASFLPLDMQPLFRWRMERARNYQDIYKGLATFAQERSDYVRAVRDEISRRGPLTARELDAPGQSKGPWWGWSEGKRALEYLFWSGEVTAAGRRAFERVYDITERAMPPELLQQPTPREPEAVLALVRKAASALGIATDRDLRDYFRLPPGPFRSALSALIADRTLVPITVDGWPSKTYLAADAPTETRTRPTALLSPFDPLVWNRARAERVFGFRYRLELYTPAARRQYGYYVLPFLSGGELVARVDLKLARSEGTLRVLGAFSEPGRKPKVVGARLAEELQLLARWLEVERIQYQANGDLGAQLTRWGPLP